MNILMPVHNFTDNPKDSTDTNSWNFAKHLAEKGNRIFIVTLSSDFKTETKKTLKEKNIYVYKVYNYKTFGLGYTESFIIFLFCVVLRIFYKFDWIYIHDEAKTPFSHFKLGAKLASRLLKPHTKEAEKIFKGEDWAYDRNRKNTLLGWKHRKQSFVFRCFNFFAIRIFYRLFPVTKPSENSDILFCEGTETLFYARKIKRKNPVYLPLGVEDYRFDDFKGELINVHGKFIYLFVGKIMCIKGIFNLLKAFKLLTSKYSNIELWVIGGGHYDEYAKQFKKEIKGFEDKVKIIGEQNRHSLVRYMKSCHVVVDTMIWANFSAVALEALYCKKPLIAPYFGNCKDFIKDGVSGFLVDSRDIDLLAQKMAYFYNNYDKALLMGKRGHNFVKNHLTWWHVIQIMSDNFKYFNDEEKLAKLNKNYETYNY